MSCCCGSHVWNTLGLIFGRHRWDYDLKKWIKMEES